MSLGERAEAALRAVSEAKVIAFDTETTGLDWKRDCVVGYVVTVNSEANWYVPVRHGGGGNLNDPDCPPAQGTGKPYRPHRFEAELKKAFDERIKAGRLTVLHNAKFDMHMAFNHGISLGRLVEDTGINQALIDEFSRTFSLAGIAESYGVTPKKGEELYQHLAEMFGGEAERSQMENFWRTPGDDPVAIDYALGDGVTTLDVWKAQQERIDEERVLGKNAEGEEVRNSLRRVADLENALVLTVFRMERNGIGVDEDRLEWLISDTNAQIEQIRKELPEGFNARSSTDLKNYMTELGRKDWPTTALGNPSFTEAWLKNFEEGKRIIRLRQQQNMLNSFVNPLKNDHLFKGRVHPSLNQNKTDDFGTVTGRFSCNSPNMQQVPKRNKEVAPKFRSLFVPTEEDHWFYEGDYSQCEPRLYAHYSMDENLTAGYMQDPPKDAHQMASEMLGVDRDGVAKRANMGLFTGMKQRGFADYMGWDLAKATELYNQWHSNFPSIRKFHTDAERRFASRGFVTTLLGRVCNLKTRRLAYQAVSRIIQGGNADIVKQKLLDLDLFLESHDYAVKLVLTIHDSYAWFAPKTKQGDDMVAEMLRIASDVQSPPFNLRVPFVMDVGRGPNWSVASFGEPK